MKGSGRRFISFFHHREHRGHRDDFVPGENKNEDFGKKEKFSYGTEFLRVLCVLGGEMEKIRAWPGRRQEAT
jgi:hypothetical protein